MPKVSVIIPTYNRAKSIGKTIDSVLNQTHKDLEIIIVDDNSSDNTKNVINSYLKSDSHIKYIRHSDNKGAPAARNTGIRNSTGKYIALLDDDDEWFPEKLAMQLRFFENLPDDVGLLYCGYKDVDKRRNKVSNKYPQKRGNVFFSLLERNFIGSPTNLIKRECFDKTGYCDVNLKSCQDWDLWLRISKYYKIDYVPEILARRNISDISISKNIDSVLTGHKQILGKYKIHIQNDKQIHSNHLKNIGIYYGHKGNYSNSIQSLKQAVFCNPFNWKAIINYSSIRFLKKPAGTYIDSIRNLLNLNR
jgi:glycosyltransferase involved in cell wall biosynthesis